MLLARMFYLVDSGRISEPVYTAEQAPAGTSNRDFLRSFVGNLLQRAFANLQTYAKHSVSACKVLIVLQGADTTVRRWSFRIEPRPGEV